MTRRTQIVYAKVAVILAAIPVLVRAYEYGPNPGYTAAPGDNPTACIASGCHVGTVGSGPGDVKISLPAGNSGTYVPGQAMQILVQITDSTKKAYGFQLTARMGSGNLTQSGDFTTTDANTQVLCAAGSVKANGKTCSTTFPIEYIEHTLTGYEASIQGAANGSYTYSFNWTPPAAGSGPVTLYVAANCGPGDPPVTTPTDVYTANISLTPATSTPVPALTNVQDAESARTSFTSGQWVAIYGSNLANTTRFWTNSDFTGGTSTGSPLPSTLSGVSVKIAGQPASVYYISPTQLNVLSPSSLTSGPAPVVVTNNGSVSSSFSATVVQSSPSFFYYAAGGNLYPLAVHLSDGNLVGDPAVLAGTEKAHPGEVLEMFINGIAPSTGGMIVPVTAFTQPVTIMAGSTTLGTSAPYLVSAGEFQVNATLPASIATGNYTLSMSVPNGSTSTAGVTITFPVGP
jgi:uncharacterized protein (TIGR03437 family)